MDKIKVGDVLKKGNARITITEIYLSKRDSEFKPIIVYNWKDVRWRFGQEENGMQTSSMDWEGWEKV